VYLDATALPGFARRFPTVFAACSAIGVDPAADPIPVSPAAHYCCGGVVTDVDGRTGVAVLAAAGTRTESRGCHVRTDFPRTDDTYQRSSLLVGCSGGALTVRGAADEQTQGVA
jgi:aspartate oxidase